MSLKILTSHISDFNVFINNPRDVLNNSENDTVAVLIDNMPAFYAISEQRLARLLEMEKTYLSHPTNNFTIDNQFCKEQIDSSIISPVGKFAMYSSWKPDEDFQKKSALWGIFLTHAVTSEELTAFITYWQAEGKMFHHIQWQQKLARSIQVNRSNRIGRFKHDINVIPETDNQIPVGFRG